MNKLISFIKNNKKTTAIISSMFIVIVVLIIMLVVSTNWNKDNKEGSDSELSQTDIAHTSLADEDLDVDTTTTTIQTASTTATANITTTTTATTTTITTTTTTTLTTTTTTTATTTTTTTTVATLPSLDEASVGEIVKFGNYNWIVLEKQSGQTLLLCTENVREMQFFTSTEQQCYCDSPISSWLNSEFLNGFSAEEQSKIIPTNVADYESTGWDTDEKVYNQFFILNSDEAWRYGSVYEPLIDGSDSWLRTLPFWQNDMGALVGYGYYSGMIPVSDSFGVRPAVWVGTTTRTHETYPIDFVGKSYNDLACLYDYEASRIMVDSELTLYTFDDRTYYSYSNESTRIIDLVATETMDLEMAPGLSCGMTFDSINANYPLSEPVFNESDYSYTAWANYNGREIEITFWYGESQLVAYYIYIYTY